MTSALVVDDCACVCVYVCVCMTHCRASCGEKWSVDVHDHFEHELADAFDGELGEEERQEDDRVRRDPAIDVIGVRVYEVVSCTQIARPCADSQIPFVCFGFGGEKVAHVFAR